MTDPPVSVAHIVTPAKKMHEVLFGPKSKVKALCGAWMKSAPNGNDAVCRPCFDRWLAEEVAATETQVGAA